MSAEEKGNLKMVGEKHTVESRKTERKKFKHTTKENHQTTKRKQK